MPLFDFKCNKCEKVIEKIVSHSQKDLPIDCDCDKRGKLYREKTVGKTNISFKGKWFSNSGTY